MSGGEGVGYQGCWICFMYELVSFSLDDIREIRSWKIGHDPPGARDIGVFWAWCSKMAFRKDIRRLGNKL